MENFPICDLCLAAGKVHLQSRSMPNSSTSGMLRHYHQAHENNGERTERLVATGAALQQGQMNAYATSSVLPVSEIILEAVAMFCSTDNSPFNIVEQPGFRALMLTAASCGKKLTEEDLPGRKAVAARIEAKYVYHTKCRVHHIRKSRRG